MISKPSRVVLFAVLVVIGGILYLLIDYLERRSYQGETVIVSGIAVVSIYEANVTPTGKGITKMQLNDGKWYALPPGEMVVVVRGDEMVLQIPKDRMSERGSEADPVWAVSYERQRP